MGSSYQIASVIIPHRNATEYNSDCSMREQIKYYH